MGVDAVDASNSCVPPTHPLTRQSLPLPTASRGEPVFLDGDAGRLSEIDDAKAPCAMYAWGKLIVVREIDVNDDGMASTFSASSTRTGPSGAPSTGGFVYRGHSANVTAAKFNPAGTYVASGDARGKLRLWAYDHEEHLPKLEVQVLAGPIRDISWDSEGRRIVVVGDGMQSPESAKVIQWDTGVKCGDLGSHARKKGSSCAFRPCRPMRIATGGGEDASVFFHKGPPFQRVVGDGVVSEKCHERGAVHSLRYNRDGSMLASVGTDGSVCFYEGKGMGLITRVEKVHNSSIFSCTWNRAGSHLLTCGADGFVKMLDAKAGTVASEWDVARCQSSGETGDKVPQGTMLLGCTVVKGDMPVSVGYNGQIAVLAAAANGLDEPRIITGHQAPISAMTFGPPGANTLYTADTDGVIVEWDGATGVARGRVSNVDDEDLESMGKVHAGATVSSLTFSGGALYSAGWDDYVRTTHGRVCNGKLKMDAQPNAMACGTNSIVVMTVEGLVLVKDEELVSEMIRLPYTATAACLSKDDSTLYVGGDDCNIYIYGVSSSSGSNPLGESHVIKGGHLKPVQSLALSPDGTKLAAADVRDVCIYDTKDHSNIVSKGRWCFHTQRIRCLAWSPDGSVVASGGNDDNIFLWCPTKKTKRVHYRFAHRGGVKGLGFVGSNATTGGEWMLVSAGADGCINWWNVEEDAKKKFGL
mmetsp:Transcript_55889/g.118857  ORF Transcript_55889/g.118857 Transcript_55889/m.118857 type:complete len:698 (-) Transcript_55889:242-2335(-)